jgi:hypothetical protein
VIKGLKICYRKYSDLRLTKWGLNDSDCHTSPSTVRVVKSRLWWTIYLSLTEETRNKYGTLVGKPVQVWLLKIYLPQVTQNHSKQRDIYPIISQSTAVFLTKFFCLLHFSIWLQLVPLSAFFWGQKILKSLKERTTLYEACCKISQIGLGYWTSRRFLLQRESQERCITLFSIMIPCSDLVGTKISEGHAASIFRVMMKTMTCTFFAMKIWSPASDVLPYV